MVGFTTAILIGAALGLRLRMMAFLVTMCIGALLYGLLQGMADSSFMTGLGFALVAVTGLQIGYVLGILARSTLEAKFDTRPTAMRGGRN